MDFLVQQPGRLDTVCALASGQSRSQTARWIEDGLCRVNGLVQSKTAFPVKAGQQISLTIPPPKACSLVPEEIPIQVLYEDADLAVVEKPRGMVVHPAPGNETGTLVNALLTRLDHLSGIGGELRPGLVHRLDKDTSGLLLIAKNDGAHQALSQALAERRLEKHYLAVAEGCMKEAAGHIDAPIGRSKADRKKMAVTADGRNALTDWALLENLKNASLLDVHIITGRTHQIRVHMQSIHHPLAGDPLYGLKNGVKVPCLMLHAYSLRFTHPSSGKDLFFVLPPPEDFVQGFLSLRTCRDEKLPFALPGAQENGSL